jgi:hypothetical protein
MKQCGCCRWGVKWWFVGHGDGLFFWNFTRRLLVKWEKNQVVWNKKNTEYVSK